MQTFKPGDKVYFPSESNSIHELQTTTSEGAANTLFSLTILFTLPNGQETRWSFTNEGKYLLDDKAPSIFPANEHYRRILNDIYEDDFEMALDEPKSVRPTTITVGELFSKCDYLVTPSGATIFAQDYGDSEDNSSFAMEYDNGYAYGVWPKDTVLQVLEDNEVMLSHSIYKAYKTTKVVF